MLPESTWQCTECNLARRNLQTRHIHGTDEAGIRAIACVPALTRVGRECVDRKSVVDLFAGCGGMKIGLGQLVDNCATGFVSVGGSAQACGRPCGQPCGRLTAVVNNRWRGCSSSFSVGTSCFHDGGSYEDVPVCERTKLPEPGDSMFGALKRGVREGERR